MFSMCCDCIHISCTYYIPCLFIIFMSFYIHISQVKSVQLLLFTYPSKFYILLSQWYCNVLPSRFFWFCIDLTTMSQFFLLICFSYLSFQFLAHTHTHAHARTHARTHTHTHFIGCCLSSNSTIHSWTPCVHPAVVRFRCHKSCDDWHWMIWKARLLGNLPRRPNIYWQHTALIKRVWPLAT